MATPTIGFEQLPQNIAYAKGTQAGQASSSGSGGAGGGSGIIGGLLQTGFGIGQAIRGNRDRKKFAKMAEAELNAMPEYTTSPYALQQLSQAQSQNNAINPATAMLYRQAQQAGANVAAAGQRNAQSGAEAIQAAAMGQNQAMSIMPQIAQMQTDYNMINQEKVNRALQGLTGERQNVFNSRLAKNQARYGHRLGQLGGANNEFAQGWTNTIGGANSVESGVKDLVPLI